MEKKVKSAEIMSMLGRREPSHRDRARSPSQAGQGRDESEAKP